MTQLAGLPMYDFAEIRPATDAFWHAVYQELVKRGVKDAPATLSQPHDLPKFWSDNALLIGQTCGYPLMIGLCGHARYVATPKYKTRFSNGAEHKSLIIAQRQSSISALADARGKICAINMADSNTGMNLVRLEIAKLRPQTPFFANVYETGAHRKSMRAVADGDADIASIDCVTFALIERIDPSLTQNLKIIGETELTPALPFITSRHTDDQTCDALRHALHAVISAPHNQAVLETLMIDGLDILPANRYHRVREIENQAIALGYPKLI